MNFKIVDIVSERSINGMTRIYFVVDKGKSVYEDSEIMLTGYFNNEIPTKEKLKERMIKKYNDSMIEVQGPIVSIGDIV